MSDWTVTSLGECGKWLSGGTPPNLAEYWGGDIPWISAKSLHKTYVSESDDCVTELGAKNGTRLVPENTILILVRGMMLKKRIPLGITTRSVTFNQDVKAIVPNPEIEPLFLLNMMISKEPELLDIVEESSHGTGKLSTDVLQDIEILLPPLHEQRAIAAILSTWDEAITLTTRLIDALQRRKQALMQLLLTGAVRFPGFDGAWEEKRIDEVFQRITRKNKGHSTNVLTISAQHGLVSQTDFFNKLVASEDVEGYYLIERGDFVYNRSYSTGYPYGAIKRLDTYLDGILSTLYLCFRLIDDSHDSDFWTYYFDNGALNKGIYEVAQEGARNHGLLNIALDDFFGISVPVPELKEQRKLSAFFQTYDEALRYVLRYKDSIENQKRGLMQQLLTGAVRVGET